MAETKFLILISSVILIFIIGWFIILFIIGANRK